MDIIYVPIPLMLIVLRNYEDWNIFGRRLHLDNLMLFESDKEGFLEFEVEKKKRKGYCREFNEMLKNSYYINIVPDNY